MSLETAPETTAQAVEHIREQGDSLDNLRPLYRRMPIGSTAAMGAGLCASYAAAFGIVYVPQSHALLVGAASGAAYITGRARNRRDGIRFDKENLNQTALQDEYGITAEVFSRQKN